MIYKNNPTLLVSKEPARTALLCLLNHAFNDVLAHTDFLENWDKAVRMFGAYALIQRGDVNDSDVVGAFRMLPTSITLPFTVRVAETMNNTRPHVGNGYLFVPPGFPLPYYMKNRVVAEPNKEGLCRVAGKAEAYFITAIGYAPRVILSEYSARQVREAYRRAAEGVPLPYKAFDYSETPMFKETK